MPTATLSPDRYRTFVAGDQQLEHPVDALGRARFRAAVDRGSVRVLRSTDPTVSIPFVGTAILFNSRTWIGTSTAGYWEQIAPEAVTKTLSEADVRFVQNHDPNLLLARTNPKMRDTGTSTLTLTSTALGLVTEAAMAPTTYARDLAILLERGDINQMSFAFEPLAWTIEYLPDGTMLITITELRLFDVSVVTYPAYEETDAGLRAAAFDVLCRAQGDDPTEVLRRYLTEGDAMTATNRDATPATRSMKRDTAIMQTRALNGWAFGDLWDLLDAAIVAQYSTAEFDAYWYVGVYDISDTWVVYWERLPGSHGSSWYQCDYTVDADGNLALGTPVEVRVKTTYIPVVADTPADPAPAEMQTLSAALPDELRAAATRTLEQRTAALADTIHRVA